jgi:hypothetical protein
VPAAVGSLVRDEPEPPQRAQLQRHPELTSGAVLAAHEPEVLAVEAEEARQVAVVDRLWEPLQPFDLGVGEKPGRHGSEVDLQPLDRQQPWVSASRSAS